MSDDTIPEPPQRLRTSRRQMRYLLNKKGRLLAEQGEEIERLKDELSVWQSRAQAAARLLVAASCDCMDCARGRRHGATTRGDIR